MQQSLSVQAALEAVFHHKPLVVVYCVEMTEKVQDTAPFFSAYADYDCAAQTLVGRFFLEKRPTGE